MALPILCWNNILLLLIALWQKFHDCSVHDLPRLLLDMHPMRSNIASWRPDIEVKSVFPCLLVKLLQSGIGYLYLPC
eukprot:6809750-Karenia_brevis.AAC.1